MSSLLGRVLTVVALGGISLIATTAGAASASSTTSKAVNHGIVSASVCRQNQLAGSMVFVSPFGYDASAGLLDVIVAKQLGYFSDLCLDVSIVASSSDPYGLVSAGRGTITAEGSAADDLVEVANGGRLTAIATYGDVSDYSLLTTTNITKLTQLEGKTLGYHTVLPVAITEMLHNAGVDIAKVRLIDDTSYDPTLLDQGKFAALQAYRTNEPLTLAADHDPFREWLPSSFGVKGTFNVEVVNRSFLAEHPGSVKDFLRAELHAFSYCALHESRCVNIEAATARAAGDAYLTSHELQEWKLEVQLAERHTLAGKGVGVQSVAEWQPEADAVVRYGLAKKLPELRSVMDASMAASLYHGKTLTWPGP